MEHRKRGGGRFLARRLSRPRGVQSSGPCAFTLRRTLLLSDHLHLCHRPHGDVKRKSVSSRLPFPSREFKMQPSSEDLRVLS